MGVSKRCVDKSIRILRASTYCRLENTLITPIELGCLFYLLFRGIRIHDPILARNLLPGTLLVVSLNALVLVELGLEERLERLQLGGFGVARTVGGARKVALKALDAVLDRSIANLGLSDILL